MHLAHISSRRCEIVTYCHTLIRPGYCPLCLGNESLLPSQRMRSWKRSNDLRAHVNGDLKKMAKMGKYMCTHPMCKDAFADKMGLRYHLSDVHGFQKTIWAMDEKHIGIPDEELGTQLGACVAAKGEKRMLNTVGESGTESQPQKKKVQRSIRSPGDYTAVEDLRIIQWQPLIASMQPNKLSENTSGNAKNSDPNTMGALDDWTASTDDQGHNTAYSASATPSLALSQSTSPSESSMEMLIDPQLLGHSQDTKTTY